MKRLIPIRGTGQAVYFGGRDLSRHKFGHYGPIDDLLLIVVLETLGETEGSLYEDDGDGNEYTNGGYLLTNYTAEIFPSVATLMVANTEGLWKRSNHCLLVKLLLGKGAMLESFVTDGETMQIAMPSQIQRMRSQGW
ncbi:unnamed protein product [Cuscuta epithymum]|uniref:DUF5110 domain-containing protein n=1 Tax=Cuscuta epithymum TaxID=186058 RepID=A0AAV0F6J7_9ASTE|nr:unnamed protein product [Cuscuta epithymum]